MRSKKDREELYRSLEECLVKRRYMETKDRERVVRMILHKVTEGKI